MDQTMDSQPKRIDLWPRFVQCSAVVISLPFLASAAVLGTELMHLPSTTGQLALARLLGAALFSFGFFLGLIGAAYAITASTEGRRTLGTAVTLFGCSHVVLGFVVRKSIIASVTGGSAPVLLLALPVVMWAYSVWLAVRAPGLAAAAQAVPADQEPIEEQPQPLSRP